MSDDGWTWEDAVAEEEEQMFWDAARPYGRRRNWCARLRCAIANRLTLWLRRWAS